MTYEEAVRYIGGLAARGSKPGTQRVQGLLNELGNPERHLEFVHVTGTNGKGSVCTFISSVLTAAGYRTGMYLSPEVFSYEERFQICGKSMPKEKLAVYTERVKEASERMEKKGLELPTLFETETAMALLYFLEEKCDPVILEAGMGGRDDATNVIPRKIVSVITSVEEDHRQYLGSTLEEIALAKAGIIKEDRPVVYLVKDKKARAVIEKEARAKDALTRPVQTERFSVDPYLSRIPSGRMAQLFTYKHYDELPVTMLGRYQPENAAVAVEALETLSDWGYYKITKQKIYQGLAEAFIPGRFELIREDPCVFLDGAHNPDAVRRLLETLRYYFPNESWTAVTGSFKDKDVEAMTALYAEQFSRIFTVTPPGPRGMKAEDLKSLIEPRRPEVRAMLSVREALEDAIAATNRRDVVVVFGSLSILKEARRAAMQLPQKRV